MVTYNTGSSVAIHWNPESERMVWRVHLRGVETPFHRWMQLLHEAARDGDGEISSLTSLPFLRVDLQEGVLTQQARQSPLLEASILGHRERAVYFSVGG